MKQQGGGITVNVTTVDETASQWNSTLMTQPAGETTVRVIIVDETASL